MVNSYSLGKDSKFGNIDFSKLKSGITKQELGIQEGSILDSIWKRIDTNQEGDSKDKLDRQELNQFIKIISELCGKDTNLSTGEAKNFETEDGKKLGRKHKEELLTFLSKLSALTKGVAKVETETATNVETITYEDGHTEKVKPDGSKIIISKDGKTITEKDADGNTTKEIVKTDDSETVTEYEPSSTNPKKQTKTNKDSKSVILYSQSKPIKQTTTIEKTGEVQEFDFVEDKPVLRKTTNPKTGETVVYSDGKPASRSITTKTEEGTRVSNTVYDGNDLTENVSINGKERYQKKVIDGREYEVSYDENGNTIGIIVQNGETIKSIADKFGVSVEDLIRANASKVKGKYPKAYFLVGEEIKIPRQMNADEKVLQGRKSASETRADYQRSVELQRQKAEEARMKKQTVIAKGKNGYYVTKDGYGTLRYFNANKKEISAKKFKEVCPIIYKNVTEKEAAAQRGATQRTRKKYDTATIQKEACELAKAIHNQISGASINENTINMLRGITPKNAAFVVSEYKRMYGVSLAKDIDDEWGLDLNTVKEHICKKLVDQAKQVGLKCSDYNKINNLSSLQNWINKVSEAIINKMPNATETYYATEAEESQRQQSAKNAKTAKASAEQIVNDLIKHTSGWNDVDKIKAAIARIDNPEELKEVNRLLTIKGYPPTDKYSPIENFIYQEANNSAVHTYNSSNYLEQVVHGWIDNGTLKGKDANEAQARMAARVLYDGGDGFGTDCDKIEKAVRMIKCPKPTGDKAKDKAQAREVYRFVNEMIKKHNTFYGLGSRCTDLLDYCKGEMWDSEVKYLNGILAETNAIQGNKKAQAIKDLTQEAVEGAGTNIEYLEQAIKGIDSPKDRKAVEAKLAAYCKKKGIKPQIQGQAYLQAILYDECDTFMGISTDHKEIRKFNEMLIEQGAYTEAEIVNLRAEQAALQILAGDFDNIKDAVEQIKDPKVLTKVKVLLKSKKYNSLDEFLSKKLNQTKSDLINAELASNNLLPNEKAADVAYRLMQNSAFDVRAMGVKAIRNEQVAKAVDAKFKQKGGSLAKFMEQFNKEKAEYKSKADFWDGWGKLGLGFIAEEISDAYKENTDSSDNMFVEMQSAQSLTPQQKSSYDMTVKLMEQKLAQMKKDYQAALDSQGAVSWAVNKFCEQYGIGTTREEIQARIEHDTETVRLLKLAAEGKLGKMVNGKTVAVTFEEVFKERNVGTNFDTAKVAKVQNQAEMLVAMNYAKTNIAVCWEELENGLTSSDSKCLSVAIIDTLDKLSQMTGQQLSLAGYGYTVKDGIILDSNGKSVSVDKLRALANKLKQGLSDVAKDLLGTGIPLNTSSSKIEGLLEDSYNKKKESFKQEFKNAFGQDCPDEMVEDYISTIETGKMVVNMGVLIGAVIAAPFTGGGSLAVFVAGAGASLGLNALEHSTDANGWTNAEWTSDMEQAFWDGALAAVGMKVGKYAEGFAQGTKVDSALMKNLLTKNTNMLSKVIKDPKKLQQATKLMTEMEASGYKMTLQMAEKMNPKNAAIVKPFIKNPENYKTAMIWVARAEAMGFEVSSDTLQSLVQMYCQEGKFNEEAFINGLIMSVAGNAAGHVAGTIGDVKGGKNTTPDVNPSAKQKQAPPSQDKPKYIVPEKETPFEKATRNGNNPNKVAPSGSVGKLGPEKFNAVKENLADELTQITSASDPHLETLQKRIDALHNREQRRELQKMLNNKKAELNANQTNVDESKVKKPKVEELKVKEPKADKNASVNAKQNTDTHVKNINDIKDMRNLGFNSVNETIEFFQYNGFEVEKLSGTYKRAWGNSIEYQCTAKDGNVIYQFSVKPDGTTEITGIKIGIGKKGNVTTDTTEKADKPKVDELKAEKLKVDESQEGIRETKNRHIQSKVQRIADYSKMSPEELAAEYQELKKLDKEATRYISRPSKNGTIYVSASKYQDALDDVKNVLDQKGYKLTRTRDANDNTIYSTKPKETTYYSLDEKIDDYLAEIFSEYNVLKHRFKKIFSYGYRKSKNQKL